MRVYEELTSIEPKVMAGFTWRQLLAVVVVGAVTIGLVVALFLAGTTDFSIVSWIVMNRTGPDGGSGYWIPTRCWSVRFVA
ncbi:PrgI family protein [Tessaracoccus sp. MC1865]|nr:PrgI family protein [Tessaracoccus sp. MC1865]